MVPLELASSFNVINMNEWEGKITVKVHNENDVESFCKRFIPGFDPGRYKVLAVRVFAAGEFIVTVYAIDKLREDAGSDDLKVRKFKLENVTMQNLFNLVEAFNFTVSDPRYALDHMKVLNK
jgi:hypothetical protein